EGVEVGSALESAADFAELQSRARAWLEGWDERQVELKVARDEARDRRYPINVRQSELRRERDAMESQAGRMPARMHEMRAEVAAAGVVDVETLPFVAELSAVGADEGRWRLAVETVLASSARTMLVPLDRLDDFSAAIDGLRIRGRLHFEGAETHLGDLPPED